MMHNNTDTASGKLFQAIKLGTLTLPNRIIMAPLTRSRAGAGDVQGALNAQYYAQRATAGLIISEATQISQQGKGYAHTPGIYSKEQVADLVCFGRPFIANPDLVNRLRMGAPLVAAPKQTWYGGGAKGYTDWSRWGEGA